MAIQVYSPTLSPLMESSIDHTSIIKKCVESSLEEFTRIKRMTPTLAVTVVDFTSNIRPSINVYAALFFILGGAG